MALHAPSRLLLLLAAAALAAGILRAFPAAPWLPPCPIHLYTGLLCPGCGTTRACEALLGGHVREAVRLNALVVLLLPLAAAWSLRGCWRGRFERVNTPAVAALLGAAVAFSIARNVL